MRKILLLSVFAFALSSNLASQISFKTEYIGKSNYKFSDSDEKKHRVGNSKGSAMIYEGGFNIPLSMKINENNRPTMWSVAAGGTYAFLNNYNFTDDLVIDKMLNLGISIIHLRPITKRWSMFLSLGGAMLTSDTRFSQIRGKHLLVNGSAIFIYHWKPNLDIGGGMALNNSFGYPMIFPALYFKWSLEKKVSVNISMLDGLKLSAGYGFNKHFALHFVTEMNGQMAIVEKDDKTQIFSQQYIVVGLRPQINITKKIAIPITLGISAIRNAEFRSRNLKSMFKSQKYYFDIAPYISAGLTLKL